MIALSPTSKATLDKITLPVVAMTYPAFSISPTLPVEVISPVAAGVAPAQPSTPPPPAPSSQRPLPHRPEYVASHVTVTDPLKQRDKGVGTVGAVG